MSVRFNEIPVSCASNTGIRGRDQPTEWVAMRKNRCPDATEKRVSGMCSVYMRNKIRDGWFAEGGNRRQSVGNRRQFRKMQNLFLNDRRYDCRFGQSNGRSSTPTEGCAERHPYGWKVMRKEI